MKKITLFCLCLTLAISLNAQTVAWSSDSEDLTGWSIIDGDEDGNNWGGYTGGGESLGFDAGALFYSESWSPEPAPTGTALTPDNYLLTPSFTIPGEALSISYKMKVAAIDPGYFEEKYAVYVFDEADEVSDPALIYEEVLTEGGDGTAKDITAEIPASFAGKTLVIIIRHFDCTDQNQLLIDDFEVSYSTTLSAEDKKLAIAGAYPNPVVDVLKIDAQAPIDSAIISNQLGQQVLRIESNAIINNRINLSELQSGMYFLFVKADNKTATLKIIKK